MMATNKSKTQTVTQADLDEFDHITEAENAEKIWSWLNSRGGIAIWRSINLSNPGKTWTTPACKENGEPTPKPSWQVESTPTIITDSRKVGVAINREVKHFRIAIRRGAQGLSYKVTDAGSKRIWREIQKAGPGAFYEFDYESQEAIIKQPDRIERIDLYISNEKEKV